MVADIWQWTPLMFLILLSGLVALPEDQTNAARILGASFYQQMRRLVLPMLKPVILIALIIRAIEVFKIFDSVYLMTKGGPGTASETISTYLVKQVNVNGRWGYASSVAILVLIFVSIIAHSSHPADRAGAGRDARGAGRLGDARRRADRASRRSDRGGGEGLMAAETPVETRAPVVQAPSRSIGNVLKPVGRWSAILLFAAVFGFPLYWVITMSFKPLAEWNPPGKVVLVPGEPDAQQLQGRPRHPGSGTARRGRDHGLRPARLGRLG